MLRDFYKIAKNPQAYDAADLLMALGYWNARAKAPNGVGEAARVRRNRILKMIEARQWAADLAVINAG